MTSIYMPRLGDGGIRLPAKAPAGVTSVDCTPVVRGRWEHGYLWKNSVVQRDVRAVLKGGAPDEIANRRFDPSRHCWRLVEGESS